MNKSSKIISTSEYYKKLTSLSSHGSNIGKESPNKKTHLKLPNEILIKIFEHLNFIDLLKCSLVSKQWNEIASSSTYWTKWARIYKLENEFNSILKTTGLGHLLCFKKLYERKLDLAMFKLAQKIKKKTNKFSLLPDLNILKSDIGSMVWTLEFHDKKDKCLHSLTTNDQSNFESSLSVIWSNLSEINSNIYKEIDKMIFFLNIPFYIDLKTGLLSNQISKFSSKNINKKTKIKELSFKLKIFEESDPIYQDKLVEIYSFDQFLFALWKTANQIKQFAFISAHIILDHSFLKNVFPYENNKISEDRKTFDNLELDSQYGLHDYKIYFCIRNQTKTIFLSELINVYKARIKKYDNTNFLNLEAFDCDMVNNVGPCLKMLPKFTWKSHLNPKNNIDLFGIIDLCIFDSNNRLIISKSFPVNFGSESFELDSENFVVSQDIQSEYKDKDFILKFSISTLKDEFSIINGDISYYLTKLDIFLPISFVNKMFGTAFSEN